MKKSIRKTFRLGLRRTSFKLEPVFWNFLREEAEDQGVSVKSLVRKITERAVKGDATSELRVYCMVEAWARQRS